MGEEERSAPVGSERKLDALEIASVDELTALDPAFVIGLGGHRIARRRSGEHISDEALVPAADRMVQREAVGRAPVPGERNSAALGVPIPLRLAPKIGDAVANSLLLRRIAIEIGARAQEPLEQERALDQIGAVVLAAERLCRAGVAVHEMGIETVIAGRPLEAVERLRQASERLGSRHPSALAGDDHGHHAKAGAARRDVMVGRIRQPSGAIARQPAHGLRAVPEKEEGLALDEVKQGLVGELLLALDFLVVRLGFGGMWHRRPVYWAGRDSAVDFGGSGIPCSRSGSNFCPLGSMTRLSLRR